MAVRWLLAVGLTLALSVTPAHAADRAVAEAALVSGANNLLAGQKRKARADLLNAVRADPKWGLAHAVNGRVLLALGDGVAAQAELERALALGVPAPRINQLIAHAWLLQGNARQALAEAAPDRVAAPYRGYAARIRARALVALDDFAGAAREFDVAIAGNPEVSGVWVDVGRFRLSGGNVSGALDAATNAVAKNPRDVDALMLMGELVRGRFGLIAAIPWFERVLLVDPNHVVAMGELAATLGDAGRTRAMLAMTRRMLAADEGNPHAYYLQAVLAARADMPALARAMLYRTKNRLDDVPGVKLLQAVLELQAGNRELAIDKLEELVASQPDNLKAQRLLGSALWRAGDTKGAIRVLQPVALRSDADSYTLSVIGRAYESEGDRRAAATYLDRAAMPMRGEAVPFDMAGDLLRLARANSGPSDNADIAIPYITKLMLDGKAAAALSEAQRLAARNPGAPAAHVLVGDALMALENPGEAAQAYQRAADIRFSEPVALRFIDALNRKGDTGAALHVLDLFLSQNPRSVAGLLLAADHFMTTKNWARAIPILEGLRKRLGGRDVTLLGNLAWARFNSGATREALDLAASAFAIAPANPAVVNGYGWILFKSGTDRAGGMALLKKAVAIAPNHPGLRHQLGEALIATGKKAEARPHLEAAAAAEDYPDRRKAAALLAGL